MKVEKLSGALLDYWVLRAEGWIDDRLCDMQLTRNGEYCIAGAAPKHAVNGHCWRSPSTNWAVGGPIIEADQIFLTPPSDEHSNGGPNHGWRRYDHWRATVSARTRTLPPKNEAQVAMNIRGVGRGTGETALIAAMRAKVASHYGDEVPDV